MSPNAHLYLCHGFFFFFNETITVQMIRLSERTPWYLECFAQLSAF